MLDGRLRWEVAQVMETSECGTLKQAHATAEAFPLLRCSVRAGVSRRSALQRIKLQEDSVVGCGDMGVVADGGGVWTNGEAVSLLSDGKRIEAC